MNKTIFKEKWNVGKIKGQKVNNFENWEEKVIFFCESKKKKKSYIILPDSSLNELFSVSTKCGRPNIPGEKKMMR